MNVVEEDDEDPSFMVEEIVDSETDSTCGEPLFDGDFDMVMVEGEFAEGSLDWSDDEDQGDGDDESVLACVMPVDTVNYEPPHIFPPTTMTSPCLR
ncbi:hypothetical protein AX17_007196 [Amanita inopinata Kibby_2008]|nr:hypothetical protein AX17_007196 [Amanita inopinata Kibby_2008]